MKMVVTNKTTKNPLQDPDTFKTVLDADMGEIACKYSHLMVEYFKFVVENVKITNMAFLKFIIARGLDTMTNVFNHVLYYTKNMGISYSHCQKSFYFYVEFISQISEADKLFLQLSTRDASVYAYKKTICDMNSELKKNIDACSPDTKAKLDSVSQNINIYKTLFHKALQSDDLKKHVDLFEYAVRDFNAVSFNSDKLDMITLFVETFYYKLDDIVDFFDKFKLFVKTISTVKYNPIVLNEKICNYDLNQYLDDQPNVFVRRLFSS